jgi:hypothetical protein
VHFSPAPITQDTTASETQTLRHLRQPDPQANDPFVGPSNINTQVTFLFFYFKNIFLKFITGGEL